MNDHAPPHGITRPEHDATMIPDAWMPSPLNEPDGYNVGPELTATHNGVTLAIQRTHLTHVGASYYWEIRTEGTAIPLLDGVLTTNNPTVSLIVVARHLAWRHHATAAALRANTNDYGIKVWPATTRTPDDEQRAALRIIHQEALT